MASRSSLSSLLLFGNANEEDNVNQALNIHQDDHVVPQTQTQTVPQKKRRNTPGVPYPDAEVIALSPTTLMAKNRFICEVCHKGFPRDQNLELHKRGHNLPWKLKPKSATDGVKRKVYVCPEPSCVNHEPSHALGDLTGIKKHYSRKHGDRKFKCTKCEKMYAVRSDLKAHQKTCGTKEYQCHCGTIFSRRDSFTTHKALCDALAEGIHVINPMGVSSFKSSDNHNHPHMGSPVPSTQNLTGKNIDIAPGMSEFGRKSYNSPMIRTSTDLNYHKPPPTLFGKSSDQQHHHKYQAKSDTQFFTNLVNNTTTPHKNMQLYNLSFMGNPIISGSGEGSSLFSGGSIVSQDCASSYNLSSHTGVVPQLSAAELIQKAIMLRSTSCTNTVTNFSQGYASSSSGFNQYKDVTNMHEESYQGGGLHGGSGSYDDEGKNFNSEEQQPLQNSNSFNMGFEQPSGVKMTRDFLGVGMDMVGNISNDGPTSSTFVVRSFL